MGFWAKVGVLILGVVLMSLEGVIIKTAGKDSLEFAAVFGPCFAIANALILFKSGLKAGLASFKAGGRHLWLAGVAMGLSNLSFFTAVKHSGIALAVLVLGATPVMCAVISRIWLGLKSDISVYIASIFVGFGLGVIVYGDISLNPIGLLASLSCLFFYSLLFVVWSSFASVSAGASAVIGGAILALAGAFLAGFDMDGFSLGLAVFMGLVLTPVARLLLRAGSLGLNPAFVGLLLILESIIAPIFGWLILAQKPSLATIIGGGIILISVACNTLYVAKIRGASDALR